jgi:hypothetical protein
MNSLPKGKRMSFWSRIVLLTAFVVTSFAFGAACNEGREGDRCNPAAAAAMEDECGSGLTCQTLSVCMESYCCPSDPTKSSNGYCNGALWCPQQQDAGTTSDAGSTSQEAGGN